MKRLLLLLVFFLASCASVSTDTSCPTPQGAEYPFETVRTIDGDTIEVMADIGFQTYRKITVRFLNVDTPEVYGVKKWADEEKTLYTPEYAAGKAATDYTKGWLVEHCPCYLVPDGTGKYGRWLVDIYSIESGAHLNSDLVTDGHAEYIGD